MIVSPASTGIIASEGSTRTTPTGRESVTTRTVQARKIRRPGVVISPRDEAIQCPVIVAYA